MKKILILLALSLPFLFSGCAKKIEDVTVTIYGTVVDANTQTPIDGVLITLTPGAKNKYTGGDGYYEFPDLVQQQYTLTAQKTGYHTDRKNVSSFPGEMVEITFTLTPLE